MSHPQRLPHPLEEEETIMLVGVAAEIPHLQGIFDFILHHMNNYFFYISQKVRNLDWIYSEVHIT